ncbi:MAG: efflux RND transporter periplasmic adaptor subunit [Planctomycetota bacterium]
MAVVQPRRWLRRLIQVVLVLAAAGGVVVVALLPGNQNEQAAIAIPPVNVTVQVIKPIPELPDDFALTAVIEPYYVVSVAAEVSGRIDRFAQRTRETSWRGRMFPAEVELEEGEPVSKGDPLVYLNQDLLRARYDRAEVQFEFDQREYLRIQDLSESGATSPTELADARTRRDMSKVALAEAAYELERTTIQAPISGILNRLPMEVGEFASSGDPVAEIVAIDRVKVVVELPERDVHYIQLGDQAEILPFIEGQGSSTGAITYISELADNQTRTTRIEITVDNTDQILRSGQIVRARLVRRVLKDVVMIPLGAVIPLENGRVVYIVVGDVAERRQVELDFIKGRSVRVLSGLAAGDLLIVAGHRYVSPGQPVAVITD